MLRISLLHLTDRVRLTLRQRELRQGDEGARLENLVACHLLKHAQWQQDALGRECALHYLRTKDGAEVDFALSDGEQVTHLIECKWADPSPHRALQRFTGEMAGARAVQLVRSLRQPAQRGNIEVARAADWLAGLSVKQRAENLRGHAGVCSCRWRLGPVKAAMALGLASH